MARMAAPAQRCRMVLDWAFDATFGRALVLGWVPGARDELPFRQAARLSGSFRHLPAAQTEGVKTMARTVADLLVDRLIDWGVDTIFGFPGDGVNGIFEALRHHQNEIRFIQVRHEEAAAFAACGYAKYTGRLGVCLATSGPGGIHLLNGLYDAKCDGQPVLAITGHTFHDLIGTHYQQDVDLDKLFMDVAAYNQRVMGPAHVVQRRGRSHQDGARLPHRVAHHDPEGHPGLDIVRRRSDRAPTSPHTARTSTPLSYPIPPTAALAGRR